MRLSKKKTALYRCYDRDGALLYVGASILPCTRTMCHAASKEWQYDIARITLEWFSTRPKALAAERRAIREEKPMKNVKGILSPKAVHESVGASA